MSHEIRRTIGESFSAALLAGLLLSLLSAREAAAQGFISPFIGYNFSGSAGCPEITNCSDKRTDYGVSFGAIGPVVGFESELGYTKDFFGKSSDQTSNVFTFMGNFMFSPKFGPIQLYGLIGTGWMHTSLEATATSSSSSEDQIAWDGGGGLIGYFSKHVGVRFDVRYFRSFQVLNLFDLPELQNLPLTESKLNYGRVSIAGMFKF